MGGREENQFVGPSSSISVISTEAMTDRRIMITGPNRKRTASSSLTAGKGGTDKKFGISFLVVFYMMKVTLQGCDKVYNSDFLSKVVLIKRVLILNVVLLYFCVLLLAGLTVNHVTARGKTWDVFGHLVSSKADLHFYCCSYVNG